MFGPSGFFLSDVPQGDSLLSDGLEQVHSSKNGFNVLYKGSKNGRFFAYKALKPEFVGNNVYEGLLKKEFEIGFSLTHPGICQYLAMVRLPDIGNCIIMEWVDGCNLETLINSGTLDRARKKKILCELCDALDYMHRKQVIHRDLKPENIIITYNGSNVKIVDFGLSDTDSYNVFKAPAGTVHYASPELLTGDKVDNRTDIWSVGVIINELDRTLARVARKCMRRNRDNRYSTGLQVRRAIENDFRDKMMATALFVVVLATVAACLTGVPEEASSEAVVPAAVRDTVTVHVESSAPSVSGPDTDMVIPGSAGDTPASEPLDTDMLQQLFDEASSLLD